jgi:mannose/fructose/N-acetylgalactosamine-specific phosphotransferase system component IIB
VVRGVAQAAELLACGIPGPVNLGGLHLRPGAREVLPYLFLRPEEERLLAGLLASGHEIYAQDLPGNPRRDLKTLLSLEAPPPEPAP